MIFSYNWIKDYIKKKTPPAKKLAELLTKHFAEVEEIKKLGGDFTLDIDVRPNRASDCFSHLGIARECCVILNSEFNPPTGGQNSEFIEDKNLRAKDFVSVEIKDKDTCPRYTARVISGVRVASSPKWIQERLKVCGLRPINNIVDTVNYVMLETGQPLHAFDGEKLEGRKIIVRFARNRERILTLDEQKFELGPDILVIADDKKPIAVAGIKGGKIPEIDKKTNIIVLESANFTSQVIRRGSRRLNLRTDASLRFEHGISPDLTEFAANRAAYLIQKIAGGKIAKGLLDFYPKKIPPKIIRLELDYVKELLGIDISKKEISNILKRLDFKTKEIKKNTFQVSIPVRRLDIALPEDLIEEIGRIKGYEKIEAVFPLSSLVPYKRNLDIFWENLIKNILKEAGFTEVYNYSFFGEKEQKLFNFNKNNLIEVENPINIEQKYLRKSLIPNLLKNVEKNLRYVDEIRIFELGKIFKMKSEEKRMLTGLIIGDKFYELKGMIDLLLNKLGISEIYYSEHKPIPEDSEMAVGHPKKLAEIKVNNEIIGFLGEISPGILDKLEIKEKIVYFDIDFEKLSKLSSEEHEYRPISRFPAAVRDIAVLVPRRVKVSEVLNKINTAGGNLIRDIDLFDMYEGAELPQGKKNLAFHIIYQAENKTLSAEEIGKLQKKIIKALEKNYQWQVRQ